MSQKNSLFKVQKLQRSYAVLPAMAILIASCSSSSKSASATPTPDGSGGAPAQRQSIGTAQYAAKVSLPSRITTAPISDSKMNNMTAFEMKIPDGWKLEGVVMIPPCTLGPVPVFRAYSPDGLMQIRQEPTLGWRWDSRFKVDQSGCADISKPITASEFLKYYVETMQGGVHVVGPMPVPAVFAERFQKRAQQAAQGVPHPGALGTPQRIADTAALRVEVTNGSFIVEERLRVGVECVLRDKSGPMQGGQCYGQVDVLSAPQGKLDSLVQLADSNDLPGGRPNPEYVQAVLRDLSERNAAQGAAMLAEGRRQAQAFSQFMYNNFQQNMARSAAQHQAFMQQQESSFRSSMNNAISSMNARSTATSDWVDYALDQQTVTGPGGTVKVSSAYSYTWSNGQGQWYQTNNPNANPNGVLDGNWSQTTVVHGNGQPE
jgi:hypothetical protein